MEDVCQGQEDVSVITAATLMSLPIQTQCRRVWHFSLEGGVYTSYTRMLALANRKVGSPNSSCQWAGSLILLHFCQKE